MEMSIARALSELKMLDKRIRRGIYQSVFGGYTVGGKPKSNFRDVKEIEARAKADFQSINDLIKRRNQIKSAIVVSNAITEIEVAGKKMTVAEAIERKNSIEYEKMLLQKMQEDYTRITHEVDRINEEVKCRLDHHLETLLGKDGKTDAQANDSFSKTFIEQNEAKFIDPIKLKEQIEKISKEIEDFETEVDFALSTSNALTMITIDD